MADDQSGEARLRDVWVCVLAVQVVFTLTAGATVILDPSGVLDHPGARVLAGVLVLMPVAVAAVLAVRFHRRHRSERILARAAAQLMDTVLLTSREWLWAVDEQGTFTFSSPTSTRLLGYSPEELVGQPTSTVIGRDDLARASGAVQASAGPGRSGWRGVIRCRHRDGSAVWMETSGHVRYARNGRRRGVEGTSQPAAPQTAQEAAANHRTTRIRELIESTRSVN